MVAKKGWEVSWLAIFLTAGCIYLQIPTAHDNNISYIVLEFSHQIPKQIEELRAPFVNKGNVRLVPFSICVIITSGELQGCLPKRNIKKNKAGYQMKEAPRYYYRRRITTGNMIWQRQGQGVLRPLGLVPEDIFRLDLLTQPVSNCAPWGSLLRFWDDTTWAELTDERHRLVLMPSWSLVLDLKGRATRGQGLKCSGLIKKKKICRERHGERLSVVGFLLLWGCSSWQDWSMGRGNGRYSSRKERGMKRWVYKAPICLCTGIVSETSPEKIG